MPAHLIKRKDCGDTYYLVDGEVTRSLKTKVKRHAEALLQQHNNGKYNLHAIPIVVAYYEDLDRAEDRAVVPTLADSRLQARLQKTYLPRFGDTLLIDVKLGVLSDFQIALIKTGNEGKERAERHRLELSRHVSRRPSRTRIPGRKRSVP